MKLLDTDQYWKCISKEGHIRYFKGPIGQHVEYHTSIYDMTPEKERHVSGEIVVIKFIRLAGPYRKTDVGYVQEVDFKFFPYRYDRFEGLL